MVENRISLARKRLSEAAWGQLKGVVEVESPANCSAGWPRKLNLGVFETTSFRRQPKGNPAPIAAACQSACLVSRLDGKKSNLSVDK
jgi:hypothetical protein